MSNDIRNEKKYLEEWIISDKVTTTFDQIVAEVQNPTIQKYCQKFKITENESIALRYYTDDGFRKLNQSLRTGNNDYQIIKDLLNNALNKLPSYDGWVMRYVTLPNIDQYEIGNIVQYPEFISTTTDNVPPAMFEYELHHFHIKSCTGKDIKWISRIPDENEVLFSTNTKFEVLNKVTKNDVILITMEELL